MTTDIPGQAVSALQRGELIEAIKLTRQHTGLGLKEAKDAVEAYMVRHPGTGQQYRAAVAARGSGSGWLLAVAALIAAAVALYFWLR